jgi:hypothetical protein
MVVKDIILEKLQPMEHQFDAESILIEIRESLYNGTL